VEVYKQVHPNLRSELAAARGAAKAIDGADAEYRRAVDSAFQEQTACMVAAWQRRGSPGGR